MNGIVDTHVHVWSKGVAPFVYSGGEPPVELQHCQAEDLIEKMNTNGVSTTIIVQPINHKFDHSYLNSVLTDPRFASRFKGICLLDPNQAISEGESFLEQMKEAGYVGVRFNPYLWEGEEGMGGQRGKAFYKKAGELNLAVGIMCFRGLSLHYDDIKLLLEHSPETKCIIDHWGFFAQQGVPSEEAWSQLLSLAEYPQVYVKTSAFFRNSGTSYPFSDLDSRLVEIVQKFGSNRLMYGSDYPFIEQQEGKYKGSLETMKQWVGASKALAEQDWRNIFGKTSEHVFGLDTC
jgi:predicted TIM-barrel fold metal-dependent hydrolase